MAVLVVGLFAAGIPAWACVMANADTLGSRKTTTLVILSACPPLSIVAVIIYAWCV